MTQVFLLDSDRLSKLLHDALPWSSAVSSLLVSARNGSILAYAFRADSPSIKDIRTLSTTMTAAYTAASENTLIYESQRSGSISVIGPIADHILLAVSGPGPGKAYVLDEASTALDQSSQMDNEQNKHAGDLPEDDDEEDEKAKAQVRGELESVSEDLAAILRDELRDMKWPDDI